MAGALARSLRVPDDLSVVAVVMSEPAALMSVPAMTTVSVDERAMGRRGVELLISRLEGEPGPWTQILFEGTPAGSRNKRPSTGSPAARREPPSPRPMVGSRRG
jgi:DNA-binding LacI/PurR family transcriptional regulator